MILTTKQENRISLDEIICGGDSGLSDSRSALIKKRFINREHDLFSHQYLTEISRIYFQDLSVNAKAGWVFSEPD